MSVWVCICGSEKSHVPPASHAKPFSHFVTASASGGIAEPSVIVFKSIDAGQENHIYSQLRFSPAASRQCLNVRYPDKLLILEIFENPAQRRRPLESQPQTDGCRWQRSVASRSGWAAASPAQFGYVIDPQPLHITWFFQALQVVPHVDRDCRIGN